MNLNVNPKADQAFIAELKKTDSVRHQSLLDAINATPEERLKNLNVNSNRKEDEWVVGVCSRCQDSIIGAPFVARGHQITSRLTPSYKVKENYDPGILFCSIDCRDGDLPKSDKPGRPRKYKTLTAAKEARKLRNQRYQAKRLG